MKTCEDCGSRVYEYGCTWCNEEDYIVMQDEWEPSNEWDERARERQDRIGAFNPKPTGDPDASR